MTKKILYCASTPSHIINFHLPYLQYFKEIGWQVDVAVPNYTEIPYADNVTAIPFEKSILSLRNINAIKCAVHLLNKNKYDIISSHTTLAGAIMRSAAILANKQKAKSVYTSHGYFFNDSSSIKKLPYLWVEKLLAPTTELLMVMNKIDEQLAIRYKLGKKVRFIPGMGVNFSTFSDISKDNKEELKKANGFKPSQYLIFGAAEMSKRKNQGELIRAFAQASSQEPSLHLLLAGDGSLKNEYIEIAKKHGLIDHVTFLGHIQNIDKFLSMCDAFISSSRIEGLPFSIMEAMAAGLPVIASRIKGHTDLLESTQNELLYDLGDEEALADKMLLLAQNRLFGKQIGEKNIEFVQQYGLDTVQPIIRDAYIRLMK